MLMKSRRRTPFSSVAGESVSPAVTSLAFTNASSAIDNPCLLPPPPAKGRAR
jgi:hypothetical protein